MSDKRFAPPAQPPARTNRSALRHHMAEIFKRLSNGSVKYDRDMPHGMPATHADIINADLPASFRA